MQHLWTVKQLSAVLYDWPNKLAGLAHYDRSKRQKYDQRKMVRLLREKKVEFLRHGRRMGVTSTALSAALPEVWTALAAHMHVAGCPECGAAVACTECKWESDAA